MKATVFALVALAAGVVAGIVLTQREFSHEAVPIDIVLVGTSSGAGAAPKIGPKVSVINGERYDFGTMERNAHGTRDFIIQNIGDAPLTLRTGEPSCSVCIKVFRVEKEMLQPGERTSARIEWDVKTGDYEFEQSGPLETNDPKRPTVQLVVHGKIQETVRAEQNDIHFHDLSANERAIGSVVIHAFRDADFQVEKYEINNQNLGKFVNITFGPLTDEELARDPKAKGGLKMNVEIKPGLPYGDFNEPVHIYTNQNDDPITVRLIGNVASDILLMGPSVVREKSVVNLGTIDATTGKKHTVFLLVKGPYREQTKIEVKTDEPAGQFSATLGQPLSDTAKTTRYPLVIEIPPGATPANRLDGAKIHVTTTHPEVKEMMIKVRYVVKE